MSFPVGWSGGGREVGLVFFRVAEAEEVEEVEGEAGKGCTFGVTS